MATDSYSRIILGVIAASLLYLCVILTPGVRVSAQTMTQRPGELTGPGEVVVVGWRLDQPIPVSVQGPVSISWPQAGEVPLRVVVSGFEIAGARRIEPLSATQGIPVTAVPPEPAR